MTGLEQAKRLLQVAGSPNPKRELSAWAADLLIEAHEEDPALTLRDLAQALTAGGETWDGHDERWLEGLITWRRHELALHTSSTALPALVPLEQEDAA